MEYMTVGSSNRGRFGLVEFFIVLEMVAIRGKVGVGTHVDDGASIVHGNGVCRFIVV